VTYNHSVKIAVISSQTAPASRPANPEAMNGAKKIQAGFRAAGKTG
jgi:hypothetical protein